MIVESTFKYNWTLFATFRGLGRSIPCLFPLLFNVKTQRKQNHNMCLFSYFLLWDRSESLLE